MARDTQGNLISTASCPIPNCGDAEEAEALAAMFGVRTLSGLGHEKIILEMECAAVAAALKAPGHDRSNNWSTVDETKRLLKNTTETRIIQVRKESNRAADALAKLARSAGSCIWTTLPPDVVVDYVTVDTVASVTSLI